MHKPNNLPCGRRSGHEIDPAVLPHDPDATARLTRRQAAAVVSKWYFPLSPRSLERAALPYVRMPGSPALIETSALLHWAERKLAAAVRLAGGRRVRVPDDEAAGA